VTLFTQRNEERPIIENLATTHGAKVQSQRTRVTLLGQSPSKYHRIGSLGLNLTYEGLLLGMRAGGPRRFQHRGSTSDTDPDKPSLYDEDRNTLSRLSHDQVIHTSEPWRRSGEGLPARGRLGRRSSPRRRPQAMDLGKNHRCARGPGAQRRGTVDTCRTLIHGTWKYL
jgi:hypothetical protein